MTYTGSNPDILALTDDQLAIILESWPHQDGLTQDMYNAWLANAFVQWQLMDLAFIDQFFG